jgi:hypothetical protein
MSHIATRSNVVSTNSSVIRELKARRQKASYRLGTHIQQITDHQNRAEELSDYADIKSV